MATRGIAAHLIATPQILVAPAVNVTPADGKGHFMGDKADAAFEIQLDGTASQGTINVTLQESDTDVNASYTAIADAQLEFQKGSSLSSVSGVVALAFGDAGIHFIGYKGDKSFIRAISSGVAGAPDFGLAASVVSMRQRHING